MSTTDVTLPSDRFAVTRGETQATAVEQARAVAEVAAAVRVAQQFPRDVTRAIERMRQACGQKALAERAFYSLPRAGGRVEGTTVHVAREIAGCWGNLDYGVREMRRDDGAGVSEMLAWAWDQETNVRSSRSFVVPHARMKDKRREPLTDLGDIANNNNSVAARAVRETIFTVLPVWFRAEAEAILAQTLKGDTGGKTLAQQAADAIHHYDATYHVSKAQLEAHVARKVAEWTEGDLALLRVLSSEIARGEKRTAEVFAAPRVTAAEVTGKAVAPPEDPWVTDAAAVAARDADGGAA